MAWKHYNGDADNVDDVWDFFDSIAEEGAIVDLGYEQDVIHHYGEGSSFIDQVITKYTYVIRGLDYDTAVVLADTVRSDDTEFVRYY